MLCDMGLRGFGSRGLGYASVWIFVAWVGDHRASVGLPPGKLALVPAAEFLRRGPVCRVQARDQLVSVCGVELVPGSRVSGTILTSRFPSGVGTCADRRASVSVAGFYMELVSLAAVACRACWRYCTRCARHEVVSREASIKTRYLHSTGTCEPVLMPNLLSRWSATVVQATLKFGNVRRGGGRCRVRRGLM